jgi:hypothetical protein
MKAKKIDRTNEKLKKIILLKRNLTKLTTDGIWKVKKLK